jgi:hypothetical protein
VFLWEDWAHRWHPWEDSANITRSVTSWWVNCPNWTLSAVEEKGMLMHEALLFSHIK